MYNNMRNEMKNMINGTNNMRKCMNNIYIYI